ncbi:hypothetical protein NP493_338g02064 [Ridgeia piscesae]|uniref:Calcineurin-like phosphoesterase domain-containing protein n=1 Tax=Ridgeia piscesae TaxID=27915 RepID=A0AAD9L3I4_RIDPI|nr:hypothetical protein NP493_338g02064 [Ridgeia piscesae]
MRVLHISDIHMDFDYTPGTEAQKGVKAGKWGEYSSCDTPVWTLENMFQHLSKNEKESTGPVEDVCMNNSRGFPPPFVRGDKSVKWLYTALAKSWTHWLPLDTVQNISRGGFYTVAVRPGLRIVSVNTNYCNAFNWWLLLNTTDPANELQWLISVLQESENIGEKVHIIGHIPPGHDACLKAWSWNYYDIINRATVQQQIKPQ